MYQIQKHLAYNVWANERITSFITDAGLEIAEQETPSSFNTIRKTIYHIWDAEVIWFTRVKGEQITTWPSESFTGNFEEALKAFTENSKQLQAYVERKDRALLDTVIRYKNLKGVEYAQPVEEILFHVVNHGSYHRGQVVTMLRALGYTNLQTTDLISYLRLQ